jgi:hypothetical protein
MFHRWGLNPLRLALGLVGCVLCAPCALSQAQGQRGEGHRRGVLRQNEPNPFSRQTTIAFTIGDADCAPGTQQHVVTIRIYNILSQIVAFAELQDSASTVDSTSRAAATKSISNLSLSCGTYVARWDGTRRPDGREAPAGVYMYQLVIDGHPSGTRKMLLTR